LVSDTVVDIFSAAGLDKPNIGILTEEFLDEVQHMKLGRWSKRTHFCRPKVGHL